MSKKAAHPALFDSLQFPTPFRELSRPKVSVLFVIGLLLCAGLIAANVLRDNELVAPPPGSIWHTLLNLKVIGNDAAVALFTALLTGLIAYRQFYQAQRPHLTYNCVRTNTVTFDQSAQGRYWTALIRNSGGGSARVTDVRYRIRLLNGATYEGGHYAQALAFLREHGIREGTDFVLFRLGQGETIRAGGDWLVLEIELNKAFATLVALDISIEVTGIAGGRFQRDIYCIPRRWIEERKLMTESTALPVPRSSA